MSHVTEALAILKQDVTKLVQYRSRAQLAAVQAQAAALEPSMAAWTGATADAGERDVFRDLKAQIAAMVPTVEPAAWAPWHPVPGAPLPRTTTAPGVVLGTDPNPQKAVQPTQEGRISEAQLLRQTNAPPTTPAFRPAAPPATTPPPPGP